jgi:hypothetical protein
MKNIGNENDLEGEVNEDRVKNKKKNVCDLCDLTWILCNWLMMVEEKYVILTMEELIFLELLEKLSSWKYELSQAELIKHYELKDSIQT